MRLLEGVEDRVVRGRNMRDGDEEEISRKEIKEVIGKLKDGKTTGLDRIPNKMWRYGGEEIKE